MDLEQHARAEVRARERPVGTDHRALHDVGGRALDRGVDRGPLGIAPPRRIAAPDLRCDAEPPEQGLDVAIGSRLRLGPLHVVPDAGILLEIGLDVALGDLELDAEPLREAEGADAVDDAVVDHLGVAAQQWVHTLDRHPEHLRGGDRVHVGVLGESLLQGIDPGHVGEHAQLDLRVIGREQQMPVLGDEGVPDLAPLLGPDRDVLQVGVVRGQPAGGGRGHGIGGVDPAVGRDLLDQRVGVGAGQLLQLAPVENRPWQRVTLGGERFKHLRAGRVLAGPRLARGSQPLLLEQHFAQLLGRAEVERPPGELVGLLLELGHAPAEVRR
jgi:hypothetical protein